MSGDFHFKKARNIHQACPGKFLFPFEVSKFMRKRYGKKKLKRPIELDQSIPSNQIKLNAFVGFHFKKYRNSNQALRNEFSWLSSLEKT
jgi:hypothetical protein